MARDGRWRDDWDNGDYPMDRMSPPPYDDDPYRTSTPLGRSGHYPGPHRMSPPRDRRFSRERSPAYDSIFDLPAEEPYDTFDEPDDFEEFAPPPHKVMRRDPFQIPMMNASRSGPMVRRGRPGPQLPVKGRVVRCSFYLEGRCDKGRDCRFSHNMTVCRFYQKGTCNKGKLCPFVHSIKPVDKKPPVAKNGPVAKTSPKPPKPLAKKSPPKSSSSAVPAKKEATADASEEKKAEPLKEVMRAIRVARFGCPEVMEITKDVAMPKPGSKQLLIKIVAAGVNPSDTYIRSGVYPKLPTLPYTPGHDAAGTVEQIGEDVKKFKKGDRVFTIRTITGAYAEYAVADVKYTFPLHESLTLQQGAGLGVPYFTAYKALFLRGNAKPGETVLIHGASGGVGLAACQAAHAHGLRVFGTAGSIPGLGLVKDNGASVTFNHTEKDLAKKIMLETGGHGVDLIIEMVSNVNLQEDLDILSANGRVMVVGSRGKIEIDPRTMMEKETEIRGVMLWTITAKELKQISSALYAGQEAGWVRPVIGNEFGLDEAADAHSEIARPHHTTEGKMVISI